MVPKRHQNIPASYLLLQEGEKILLLRRYDTGFEDGKYSLVAGHVDKGETFTQAIIREAQEEAGIELKAENMKMVHIMHRKSHSHNEERIDVFFKAEKWKGKIENKEPHKCDHLAWFERYKIPTNTIPYVKQALDCIKNNIFYSEYGWQ